MQAQALGCVMGENHPAIELEGLVEDRAEKVGVHPEIDDHFVRGLGYPAHICVTGTHARDIDLRGGWRGFGTHIKKSSSSTQSA